MRLHMIAKLEGHLHLKLSVPALDGYLPSGAEGHLDLWFLDSDGDGDPEVEVKWDLPGTAFDSGPDPVRIEVPASMVTGPLVDLITHALAATGAPAPLVIAIRAVLSP